MGHSVCVWVCTGRGGRACVYESREAFVCANREGMGHSWMRSYFSTGLWFVISAISYVHCLCCHNRAHDFKSDSWVSFSSVSLVGLSPKLLKDSLCTSPCSADSYWNTSLSSRVQIFCYESDWRSESMGTASCLYSLYVQVCVNSYHVALSVPQLFSAGHRIK